MQVLKLVGYKMATGTQFIQIIFAGMVLHPGNKEGQGKVDLSMLRLVYYLYSIV